LWQLAGVTFTRRGYTEEEASEVGRCLVLVKTWPRFKRKPMSACMVERETEYEILRFRF